MLALQSGRSAASSVCRPTASTSGRTEIGWTSTLQGTSTRWASAECSCFKASASGFLQDRRGRVVLQAATATTGATAGTAQKPLPRLWPLDSDYEQLHTFGDFANWLIPGAVMLGRYPYCEPSRCNSHEKGEQQLQKILEAGITTFISLQEELPPQDKMTLAGKNGFLPYKATAELIKSSLSPPPSMEVMMGLRNPTLNKFLPSKRKSSAGAQQQQPDDQPSYALNFVHFPILDLGIPSAEALQPLIQDLTRRIQQGEKLYIHCWGGRGRAGTVGACLLGYAYGLSAQEALERVQRAFDTRRDNERLSPETQEQREFVTKYISALTK